MKRQIGYQTTPERRHSLLRAHPSLQVISSLSSSAATFDPGAQLTPAQPVMAPGLPPTPPHRTSWKGKRPPHPVPKRSQRTRLVGWLRKRQLSYCLPSINLSIIPYPRAITCRPDQIINHSSGSASPQANPHACNPLTPPSPRPPLTSP
ncbi:unnamed protein product [Protopolystoma xenopodis]|uniref:Uncharacterized protein n=1 Tax=Protopolystoma xenopodis TaxID=117903 RepID=A0A3S5AVS5_9PLAT|nr:unnamed protein product [Protopolystoma xenopodis]